MDPVDGNEALEFSAPLTCSACNHSFRASGAFQNHLNTCKPNKKRLRKTLAAAKDVLARKRQRREETPAIASTSRNPITVRYV